MGPSSNVPLFWAVPPAPCVCGEVVQLRQMLRFTQHRGGIPPVRRVSVFATALRYSHLWPLALPVGLSAHLLTQRPSGGGRGWRALRTSAAQAPIHHQPRRCQTHQLHHSLHYLLLPAAHCHCWQARWKQTAALRALTIVALAATTTSLTTL